MQQRRKGGLEVEEEEILEIKHDLYPLHHRTITPDNSTTQHKPEDKDEGVDEGELGEGGCRRGREKELLEQLEVIRKSKQVAIGVFHCGFFGPVGFFGWLD